MSVREPAVVDQVREPSGDHLAMIQDMDINSGWIVDFTVGFTQTGDEVFGVIMAVQFEVADRGGGA